MTPTYYCVDVEATGVDLKNDRLIQLAFLKVQGETVEAFNDLCYTDIEMNDTVIAVHHITNAMLEEKYWPYETDSFLELERGNLPGNYFIAHGTTLDIAMLEHEELDLAMQVIDTDKCARQLLQEADSYKLEDLIVRYDLREKAERLAQRIGLENLDAHDALSDALWHYVLFGLLRERVEGDVARLVTLTAEPMMLEKITFGRDKGKSFAEVFEKNPGALVWMYAHMAREWPDLEYTTAHWLKQNAYFWEQAQNARREAEMLLF